MSSFQAVMTGLGIIFFGLCWIAFKFNQSDKDLYQYLGTLFLALSLMVLQLVGYSVIEIANANSMAYIVNGVTVGIYWIINIAMFMTWLVMLLYVFAYFIKAFYNATSKMFGRNL